MGIDDSLILSTLVRRYREHVLFGTCWPDELQLAKAFSRFECSHGGLMLLGVDPAGTIIGVAETDLGRARARLRRLVGRIYRNVSEMGLVQLGGKNVIFVVFNAVPDHLEPLRELEPAIRLREELGLLSA
ncbi:MAG: hypothetical protein AAGK14_12870 [Verrucomicrobiota bacterium]